MTTDLDLYRSAKLLIDQHGDEAANRSPCRQTLVHAGRERRDNTG